MILGLFQTPPPSAVLPHLRLDVGVVVVLEQQRRRPGVVFARGDVQGREPHFAFGVVLQQQRDHGVVSLLESDGERREAVLRKGGKGTGALELVETG